MIDREGLLHLVRTLAVHPVLPPAEALPINDEALRAVLADLARAGSSSHADMLRAVSLDLLIPVDELARRAQFVLACLLLPTSGTHYEVLGVAREATTQEIRKRWAALIQRYHPDHRGVGAGSTGWLDGQARRLIEAYHTLKDPARRRAYDAQLAAANEGLPAPATDRWADRPLRFAGPTRWKWAPAAIAAVGIVVGLWAYTRPTRGPLPSVPLPAAPRLLDRWGQTNAGKEAHAGLAPHQGRGPGEGARRDGLRPSEPGGPLPSLKDGLAAGPAAAPSSGPSTEVSAARAAIPAAAAGASAAAAPVTPPSSPALPSAVVSIPPTPASSPAPSSMAPVTQAPGVTSLPPAARGGPATPAAEAVPSPPPHAPARLVEPAPLALRPAEPTLAPAPAAESASISKSPSPPAGTAAPPSLAPQPTATPAVSPPEPAPAAQKPAPLAPRPPEPARAPAPGAESASTSKLPSPPPAPPSLASRPPAPRVGEAWPREEILALIESFRAAYERKDVAAVMGLFGAEARDRSISGRQAVEQMYVRNFAALDGIRYELAQLGVRPPASNGDLVVEGRFRIRATHVRGKPRAMDVAGPIRWLLRRENGALRVVAIEYEPSAR